VSVKVRELGRFIRDQRSSSRLSLRRLSKLAGISNPYLSQIERGLRRPSAEILQAIAKALRISAETLYVKAGILEERTDVVDLPGVVRRDSTLTTEQKQLLLDLYQSFHRASPKRRPAVRKVAAARKPTKSKRTAAKPAPKKRTAAKPKTAKPKAVKRSAPKRTAARPATRAGRRTTRRTR
jgi:transcriptional regulator with XRE-family HTH domain